MISRQLLCSETANFGPRAPTYRHFGLEEQSQQILAVEVEIVRQRIVFLGSGRSAGILACGGRDRRFRVRCGEELLGRKRRRVGKVDGEGDFFLPLLLGDRRVVCGERYMSQISRFARSCMEEFRPPFLAAATPRRIFQCSGPAQFLPSFASK